MKEACEANTGPELSLNTNSDADMINGKHIFCFLSSRREKNEISPSPCSFFSLAKENFVFKSHEKVFYQIFLSATPAAVLCIVVRRKMKKKVSQRKQE